MISIFCKNTGTSAEFPEGVSLLEVLDSFDFPKPYSIVSAKVNNIAQGLKYRAYNNQDVEFLDYTSYSGRSVYCRSLCFLFCKSAQDVIPGCRLILQRPISKGYYCTLNKTDGSPLLESDVAAIEARMRELVDRDIQFHRHEVRVDDAIKMFGSLGLTDKVKLLETNQDVYTYYYTLDGTPDYYYDRLVPSTSYLQVWSVSFYRGGMLLRVPDRHHPERTAPFMEQPKTFEIFAENLRWNNIMGLGTVGDLNEACKNGRATELIQISEALQEKKIVSIAEEIYRRREKGCPVRLVLITGPSGSGKTTVSNRLSIQLKACGLKPVSFSTDDYFVNRADSPTFPDGTYDFDNFDTVEHSLLQSDLQKLLDGEEVEIPHYNFVTGLREFNGRRVSLGPDSVIILEGIHALNPELTDLISDEVKYKIFINTVTSISLDNHNCIPTSDNRLLRRIVRDYDMGSFSARETINRWPMVRRAEVKWIYPHQESADVIFNSAYLIEFAVIRYHAERVLETVPKNCPEYCEAHRLLRFLRYFTSVSGKEIPATSMLREFVGKEL